MGKRWTIQIDYKTGDSFGSHNETSQLGISWENLDRAKEALEHIRQINEIERNDDWREDPDFAALPYYGEHSIMLPLDDGTEHKHSTFWKGYFEHLLKAQIVVVERTDDMVYEP